MNTSRTVIAIALAGALGVALAGCSTPGPATASATSTSVPATTDTTPAVVTPAPVATVAAPVAPAVGDPTSFEAGQSLPAGQRAYKLADKTFVVVQADLPLPAVVIAEIKAAVKARLVGGKTNGSKDGAQIRSVGAEASIASGKTVLVIGPVTGAIGNGPWGTVWMTAGANPVIQASYSKNTQIAAATAWVASQSNPAMSELIILD